ncbi:beta-1,3-galactosyltransferase 5-like [Erinaceus europaeus]|uniref:Hexosyltransferase n=1 Tax=Erinaceus europaeus TaxID=9365 RepID=A0A1S3AIS2_ERIEU|nr:beta-1,3-galactosyltransferase 5-like [Erinaceus europaeus]
MTFLKMKLIFVSLLVLGVLCLYFSMYSLTSIRNIFNTERRVFLQLPELNCEQNPPFLILLVASTQEQVFDRSVIRGTWGRERLVRGKRINTFFLLGAAPKKHISGEVSQESQRHRDIIQKDFVDTYNNLTLKTLMGMEWVHRFCPQAAFVMKTDTDTFVNIYYLTDLLLQKNRTARFFTGAIFINVSTVRDENNKWFVSTEEYPRDKYPPFCSGSGYVFSSDMAGLVYSVSQSVPFLKLEDVFVGLCLERLNITPEPLHSEDTFFPNWLPFSTCLFKKIVTSHPIEIGFAFLYWNSLENSLEEECPSASGSPAAQVTSSSDIV